MSSPRRKTFSSRNKKESASSLDVPNTVDTERKHILSDKSETPHPESIYNTASIANNQPPALNKTISHKNEDITGIPSHNHVNIGSATPDPTANSTLNSTLLTIRTFSPVPRAIHKKISRLRAESIPHNHMNSSSPSFADTDTETPNADGRKSARNSPTPSTMTSSQSVPDTDSQISFLGDKSSARNIPTPSFQSLPDTDTKLSQPGGRKSSRNNSIPSTMMTSSQSLPDTDAKLSQPRAHNTSLSSTMTSSPPLPRKEYSGIAQASQVQTKMPISRLVPKYNSLAERNLHKIRAGKDAAMLEKRAKALKVYDSLLPDSESSVYKIQILDRPGNPTLYTYDCAVDCIPHFLKADDGQVIKTDLDTYSFWIKLRTDIKNPIDVSHRNFQHAQDSSVVIVITKVDISQGLKMTGDTEMSGEM